MAVCYALSPIAGASHMRAADHATGRSQASHSASIRATPTYGNSGR